MSSTFRTLLGIEKCISDGMTLEQAAEEMNLDIEYVKQIATSAERTRLSDYLKSEETSY